MRDFFLRILQDDGIRELEPGKIICLAQNYPKHATEMKSTPPAIPYFFLKPRTSLIHSGEDIILPSLSQQVHHEVELALIVANEGKNISKEEAMSYILGYGVFLDLTARDIQTVGKKTSRPFGVAKSFDTFAPISDIIPAMGVKDPMKLTLHLEVNGQVRQHSSTENMLYDVKHIISFLSKVMTLEQGDIIATGTPQGVSEIVEGDSIYAYIDGVGTLRHRVIHE